MLKPICGVGMTHHSHELQTSDYIDLIFDTFLELRGDRRAGDDDALIGGLARLGEHKVVVIGYRAEMPDAKGYRKCSRLTRLAGAFGKPVVLFVDVPESSSLPGAELQADEAMTRNLAELSGLATPIVGVVIRESSELRAIGMCAADRVLVLESVSSGEVPADDVNVERPYLRPQKLLDLNVVDRIVAEPSEDAPKFTAKALREAILEELDQLKSVHPEVLAQQRLDRLQYQFLNLRASGPPSDN